MNPPTTQMISQAAGENHYVAIVYCNEAFTFEPGHRLRGAGCVVCGDPLGGHEISVIGAAALAGDPCRCGCVVSDLFLAHASHFPMDPDQLQSVIKRGLECTVSH